MTLLAERELTSEERAAIADEPRPGVWIEEVEALNIRTRGDGRALTQEQTDELIFRELRDRSPDADDHVITELHGPWDLAAVSFTAGFTTQQRGGIHSDPLVRLLAYRAWGERDRRWFDLEVGQEVFVYDGAVVSRRKLPNREHGLGWVVATDAPIGMADVRIWGYSSPVRRCRVV